MTTDCIVNVTKDAAGGITFVRPVQVLERRPNMGREDVAAGKVKQAKGKVNDVVGAAKGDTGQQIKGKIEKGVGKAQEAVGKATKR